MDLRSAQHLGRHDASAPVADQRKAPTVPRSRCNTQGRAPLAGLLRREAQVADSGNQRAPDAVPLVEEDVHVGKRRVEIGRVRVRIVTEEEPRPVEAELRIVAIGRELAPGETVPGPREEEDGTVLVLPVLEEVMVVEKRLVLTEELRIRRHSGSAMVTADVTLRRQHAEIERLPPDPRAND